MDDTQNNYQDSTDGKDVLYPSSESADTSNSGDQTDNLNLAEGDNSQLLAEGDISQPLTEGDTSQPLTEGDTSQLLTEGDTSQLLTEGDTSQPLTEGDTSQPLTEGDTSQPLLGADQLQNLENTVFYTSSNAGIPTENPNIPAAVDDGNDLDKLDFSAQYANPSGAGDDLLTGTYGANTFEVKALLNAKPEIYQQHVDGEGKIDWDGVNEENNNYHDHWLDSIGQDTIDNFSGSSGDGDKINISGHTVAITLLEESDNQVKLGLYSDQGADGSRGGDAHDFDVVGTLTINHDGNFNLGSDVTVDPNVNDGAFDFA
jgi:hypothetical protein